MNEAQTAAFHEHLRQSASRYFPEFDRDQIEVTLNHVEPRSASTLYRFHIGSAELKHPVLIKVRRAKPAPATGHVNIRPRLAVIEPEQQYWLEYKALSAISDHFSNANARFSTIRVLDALPEHRAIIMTESVDPDMRRLFLHRNRFLGPFLSDQLQTTFRNVGAWLRLYHSLPMEDHVTIRDATRADYEQNVENMARFLADHLGDPGYFYALLGRLDSSVLVDPLPLGRGHGDFSLRNILVGPHHRITVIDTMAAWQTCIYEDIGYFLARLRTNQIQVFTQGWAYDTRWIRCCEEEFCRSYFESDDVPRRAIKLFTLQALLDQWTSLVESVIYRRSQRTRLQDTVRLKLTNRMFRKLAGEYLAEMENGPDTRG